MAESSTASTTNPSSLSTSYTPTGTRDSAPGSHNDNNNNDDDDGVSGMASYYFVFLMLALCVVGVVVFLNFRRRRKLRVLMHHGHDTRGAEAFQRRDLAGRRYWQGRGWGSANASREEGLNEHGEAPPPYVPKTPEEEEGRREAGQQAADGGPAIPLQTLSREGAGLKPPDYEEARNGDGEDVMRPARTPEVGSSSSQRP